MTDVRSLPDAWEMIYRLGGEECCEKDDLYDIYYKISTAIFEYRMKYNLSQKRLAEKLGVTQAMVSKLESGDYNYTIEQLWKVTKKLGFRLNIEFEEINQEFSVGYSRKENLDNIINYPIQEIVVGS
jgi:transcriptional regulator with XRE-family HTH domain